MSEQLSLFHRTFDKAYPLIRFVYERLFQHPWFTEVQAGLWLGGAPTYWRDYQFIIDHGITAVLNIRAEREDDIEFYQHHGIEHIQFKVPDVAVPDESTISEAVEWIALQRDADRTVLVHCAKGRGRSAALVAAYLMREEGMSYEEAKALLDAKRPLTKLETKHERVLERWLNSSQGA
jgi:protein-tyrosine phosphatase